MPRGHEAVKSRFVGAIMLCDRDITMRILGKSMLYATYVVDEESERHCATLPLHTRTVHIAVKRHEESKKSAQLARH